MESKETVMKDERIRSVMTDAMDAGQVYGDDGKPLPEKCVAEAQAEITWDMAFQAGYDKALVQLADMTEECKQMGRQEVVDAVNKLLIPTSKPTPQPTPNFYLRETEWQAQLKKWRIK